MNSRTQMVALGCLGIVFAIAWQVARRQESDLVKTREKAWVALGTAPSPAVAPLHQFTETWLGAETFSEAQKWVLDKAEAAKLAPAETLAAARFLLAVDASEDALDLLRRALEAAPQDAPMLVTMAGAQTASRDAEAAAKTLTTLMELPEPELAPHLGEVMEIAHWIRNQSRAAQPILERAFQLASALPTPPANLWEILSRDFSHSYVQSAIPALIGRQADLAISPNEKHRWRLLDWRIKSQKGEWLAVFADATEFIAEAENEDPTDPTVLEVLNTAAHQHLRNGGEVESLLKDHPKWIGHPTAALELAVILIENGCLKEASHLLESFEAAQGTNLATRHLWRKLSRELEPESAPPDPPLDQKLVRQDTRKSSVQPVEPPWQKELDAIPADAPNRLAHLFRLWRQQPSDANLAALLLGAHLDQNRADEATALILAVDRHLQELDARKAWWGAAKDLTQKAGLNLWADLMVRQRLWLDQRPETSKDDWLLMAHFERLSGQTDASSLREASQLDPKDGALALESALSDSRHRSSMGAHLTAIRWMNGPREGLAKLVELEANVRAGRWSEAQDAMEEIVARATFDDPEHAVRAAGWILQLGDPAQLPPFLKRCAIHAQDDRLAYLSALSLKLSGDVEGAIEAFLELAPIALGSQRPVEIPPSQWNLHRSAQVFPGTATSMEPDIWMRWSHLIQLGRQALSQNLSLMASGRIRDSSSQMIVPPDPGTGMIWALAHLVGLKSNLDPAEAAALSTRARDAGYRDADLLDFVQITHQNPAGDMEISMLALNVDAVEARIDDPEIARLWLGYHRHWGVAASLSDDDQKELDADILKRCHDALLATDPERAFDASLIAWNLDSLADSALDMTVRSMREMRRGFDRSATSLLRRLANLPTERLESIQDALATELLRWSSLPQDDGDPSVAGMASVGACLLLCSRWEEGAAALDQAMTLDLPTAPAARPNDLAFRGQPWMRPLPGTLPPWPQISSDPILKQMAECLIGAGGVTFAKPSDDDSVFRLSPASEHLRHPALQLLWAQAEGDQARAWKICETWMAAEPQSLHPVVAAASIAVYDDRIDDAAELFEKAAENLDAESDRLSAASLCLTVWIWRGPEREVDPFTAASDARAPTDEAVLKRAQTLAIRMAAALERENAPGHVRQQWSQIFKVLGLHEQADAFSIHRGSETPSVTWRRLQYDALQQRRPFLSGLEIVNASPHEVINLMRRGQRDRARVMAERALRQAGAQRHRLSESDIPALLYETWHPVLVEHGFLDELKSILATTDDAASAVELGEIIAIAEACGVWSLIIDLYEKALASDPANVAFQATRLMAVLRRDAEAAPLNDSIADLPLEKQVAVWAMLLNSSVSSNDFVFRNHVTETSLRLLESDAWAGMEQQALGTVLRPFTRLLSSAFTLAGNRSIPPALSALPAKEDDAADDADVAWIGRKFARREALHKSFCDLALSRPKSFREAAHTLTDRFLAKKDPSLEALVEWLKQAHSDEATSTMAPFSIAGQFRRDFETFEMRARWVRLQMTLVDTFGGDGLPLQNLLTQIAEVIGAQIPFPGAQPMLALWEWPFDVTERKDLHTEEQLAWNQQRGELFKEFDAWARTKTGYLTKVLPLTLGFGLHDEDTKPWFDLIPEIKDSTEVVDLIQSFTQTSLLSYSNTHHILSAEWVTELLDQAGLDLSQESLHQPLRQLMGLLLDGRENQASPMPSMLTTGEDETDWLGHERLPAEWEKRRREVFDRLERLFGDTIPLPAEIHFTLLEEALRKNEDTTALEKKLIDLARTNPESVEAQLKHFIVRTSGRFVYDGDRQGYKFGVWETGLRTRWFAASLRVGQGLAAQVGEDDRSGFEWLSTWIDRFRFEGGGLRPPPPPIVAISRGGWIRGDEERIYQAHPETRVRDELFFHGLELAMKQPAIRMKHLATFLEVRLTRDEPDTAAALAACRSAMESGQNIAEPLASLSSWLGSDWKDEKLREALWTLYRTLLAEWPETDHSNTNRVLSSIRSSLLGQGQIYGSGVPNSPLIPGPPTEKYVDGPRDFDLSHPEATRRRNRWLEIVELASKNPALREGVFVDFARLHLMDAPERVLELVSTLPAETVAQQMTELFTRDESNASVARRVAWVELCLKHFNPGLINKAPQAAGNASWLAPALTYLQTDPESPRRDEHPSPPEATPNDLLRRDELLAKLMDSENPAPGLEIERFVTRAEEAFRAGQAAEAVGRKGTELAEHDPDRMALVLNDWINSLRRGVTDDDQKHWASEVLVTITENWAPTDIPASQYWRTHAWQLLNVPREPLDTASMEARNNLLDRLLAASKEGTLGNAFYEYATRRGIDDEGCKIVVTRILEALQQDQASAMKLMERLFPPLRINSSSRSIPSFLLSLSEKLLADWPSDLKPETLGWVRIALDSAGPSQIDFFSTFHGGVPMDPKTREVLQPPYTVAPITPTTTPERDAVHRILKLLSARGVRGPWSVGLSLKLAIHPGQSPDERQDALRPLLASPPDDLCWQFLTEVLSPPLSRYTSSSPYQNFNPPFSNSKSPLRHPIAQEKLEAARILQAALGEGWVPEDRKLNLKDAALTSLQEISNQASQLELKPFSAWRSDESKEPLLKIEAVGLMQELLYQPGIATGWRLVPEALPASIDEALDSGVDPHAIASQLLDSVGNAPDASASALLDWAQQMKRTHTVEGAVAAGEMAAKLAAEWTTDLPPPDWLPEFLLQWHSQSWIEPRDSEARAQAYSLFSSTQKRLKPLLLENLARFPRCRHPEWFALVHGLTDAPASATLDFHQLALEHLAALQDGVHERAEADRWFDLSRLAPLRNDWEDPSIFGDVPGMPLTVFLFEQGILHESPEWIQTECLPHMERALADVESRTDLALLAGIYTASEAEFVAAAAQWIAGRPSDRPDRPQSHGHPPMSHLRWVLRVASLRGFPLTLDQWLAIVDAPSWLSGNSPNRQRWIPASAWILWREHQGDQNLSDDLNDLLLAVTGSPANSAWALETLDQAQTENTRQTPSGLSLPTVAFRGNGPIWAWTTLQHLIAQPQTFGPALEAAVLAGLDQVPGAMNQLLVSVKQDRIRIRQHIAILQRFQSWGLLEKERLPPSHWLASMDGLSPLWALFDGIANTDQATLLAFLESGSQHDGIGSTLLQIGLHYASRHPLPPASVDDKLRPFVHVLEGLSKNDASALSAALHEACPGLLTALDEFPSIRTLPPPPDSPVMRELAKKWHHATPESLPPLGGKDRIAVAAADLLNLIQAESTETTKVLESMVAVLTRCDWSSQLPPETNVDSWVRADLARKLTISAYATLTIRPSRPFGFSRNQSGPSDQDRTRVSNTVLRFLISHHRSLQGAFSGGGRGQSLVGLTLSRWFNEAGWDGKVVAEKLMSLVPAEHPADVLIVANALGTPASGQPFLVRNETQARLDQAAADNPRYQPLAGIWRYLTEKEFGSHLQDPSQAKALPSPFDLMPSDSTPEVRLNLAHVAPVPNASQAALIADLAALIETSPPPPGGYWSAGDLYTPWLPAFQPLPEMSDSIKRLGEQLQAWLAGKSASTRGALLKNTSSSIVDYLVLPVLDLLRSLEHRELHATLKPLVWSQLKPPLANFLHEMTLDPAWAATALPDYLDSPQSVKNALRFWSNNRKPQLTAEIHRAALETLELLSDETARQTLRFLLVALPDSLDQPPPTDRAQRVRDFTAQMDASPAIDEHLLRACTLGHSMVDEGLQDFLPLLQKDDAVVRWTSGELRQPADFHSAPGEISSEFDAITLWTLATALHRGDASHWKKWTEMIKSTATAAPVVPSSRIAGSRVLMPPGIPSYTGYNSSPSEKMLFQTAWRMRSVVGDFLTSQPTSLWGRLVPVLEECVPPFSNAETDFFVSTVRGTIPVLISAGQLEGPAEDLLAAAASNPSNDYRSSRPAEMWRNKQLHSLPLKARFTILAAGQDRAARSASTPTLLRSLFAEAVESGLMSLQEIAGHVPSNEPLDDWHSPASEADFLAAAGHPEAALAWIRKTMPAVDPSGPAEAELLLLAKVALHLGDRELARELLEKSIPEPVAGRTVISSSNQPVRTALQTALHEEP